ncbi:MAG: serine hydrolase family protein [Candidatus Aenigmarchaeota archaeon]|nr:serine hydrolase family protein [Candidatus Aenigmarchaeota archaeon]
MKSNIIERAVLVHGYCGTPKGGWFPWMKKELEKKRFSVYTPAMPTPSKPKMKKWIGKLREVVGTPDENLYMIGHSLGCIAVLRYIESIDKVIGGAVLVAGFGQKLEEKYKDLDNFFEAQIDWKKINKNCKKFIIIHSDDDYAVPVSNAHILNKHLNSELVIKHGMEHFSGDTGVFELSDALEAVLKLSEMVK